MSLMALAVVALLRSLSTTATPQLTIALTGDATSFRIDSASYSTASANCTLRTPTNKPPWYKCNVPLLSVQETQTRHQAQACMGSGLTCGQPFLEANVSCVCPAIAPGGCPDNLLIVGTAPSPPSNLIATAVSSSEIDLAWTASPCGADGPNSGYVIERAPSPTGPWAEIGRVP